jgi:hypothetical protein
MTHDKIKAAARKRMAETGEPYATARREVIRAHYTPAEAPPPVTKWFAIDCSELGRFSGKGAEHSGVQVDSDVLRVRMADFHMDVPRTSVRSVANSPMQTRGTIGVHVRRGQWILNGSHSGLVEITIEPPCYPPRQRSTLFLRMQANSLIVSLLDPDGFIAAVHDDEPKR